MIDILHTDVCDILGCRHPVILAGMGGVARSKLVHAVNAAGGFGFLGMVREPVALIEQEVTRLRALGDVHFGVNIIPAATEPALLESQVAKLIELAVPVVSMFWDIDETLVERFNAAGVLVVYQVGSAEEAIAAEQAGAGVLIVQGCEAGGHVRGMQPLRHLLSDVLQKVRVPVLAAGGLSTGLDLITAMSMGAQGAVFGTALLATEEAFAHDYHKQQLLTANASDTFLTDRFGINWPDGANVRVLKTEIATNAQTGDSEAPPKMIGEEEGRSIYLYSTDSPLKSMTGDFGSMPLYAGTGVGKLKNIPTAGQRVREIIAESEACLSMFRSNLVRQTTLASSVCYLGEMQDAYAGYADEDEILNRLQQIENDLQMLLNISISEGREEGASDRPPFATEQSDYAMWLLRLRKLRSVELVVAPCVTASGDAGKNIVSDVLGCIDQRLSKLIPRMPESDSRETVIALKKRIQSSITDSH